MTKIRLTEDQRRHRFRLARLAELDERIRQNDYADDLHNRHYRILKERLDVHHQIDRTAATRLVGRIATQKTRRLDRARHSLATDLDAFEKRLGEAKPDEGEVDYLTELKHRRNRQALDYRRRRKRLEKIVCDRDQEALLREKRDRWVALDLILKRKPVQEGLIDAQFDEIATAIRIGVSNRQYHEQQLRRLQVHAAAVALKRDSLHHEANCHLYEKNIASGLERIRECDEIARRQERTRIGKHCRALLIDLVSISVDIVTYKTAGRCDEVDPFVQDQWKATAQYSFVHRTAEECTGYSAGNPTLLKSQPTVQDGLGRFLDRRAMRQYLTGSASWWSVQDPLESELGCELLGQNVDRIVCASVPEPKPQPASAIRCPVVCVLGKPFAGKSALAKALNEQLGFRIVDVNGILSLAKTLPSAALDYIDMIEQEAASHPEPNGIVLDGFPFTIAQAEALQQHLSGRLLPIPERNGFASRLEASDLIPYPDNVPRIPRPPFSGSKITAIFHVDVDNETSLRRCLSRRISPMDGERFSMEVRMPEDKLIKERLQHLPDTELVSMALPESIYCWTSQYQLIAEFFKLFNIVYTHDGNGNAETMPAGTFDVVQPKVAANSEVVPADLVNSNVLREPEVQHDYLDVEVISRLHNCWVTMESGYILHVQNVLHDEIYSRMPAVEYFANIVHNYQQFIERYDERQHAIDKATAEYNDVDFNFRTEDVVKAELYVRIQNFESSMLTLMESKHKENEAERKRIEQSEWLQKQITSCLERSVSLLQAEMSRHQMMFLFFCDIESCQGANSPLTFPVVAFRADSASQPESTGPPAKKGTSASSNSKQEPAPPVVDSAASISHALDILQMTGKSAIEIATAKDINSESVLVKYERIMTRNRVKRIISYGVKRLNSIKSNASRLLDLLKNAAIARQQSEVRCCQEVTSHFRSKIEEEVPILHPIQIVDGVTVVVNESETIYDSQKDAIPSLFQQSSTTRIPLY